MENGEIKSFNTKISLKEYFKLDIIISSNSFQVGNIKYYKATTKLQCKHSIDNTVMLLLGQNHAHSSLYLFEVGHGIIECEIDKIIVYVEVVLKKHIQHLKYIEQLELFKDGERKD